MLANPKNPAGVKLRLPLRMSTSTPAPTTTQPATTSGVPPSAVAVSSVTVAQAIPITLMVSDRSAPSRPPPAAKNDAHAMNRTQMGTLTT